MPLAIQSAKLKPNETYTFSFSDTISQRLVGMRGFQLSYGDSTDHHVETVSISMSVSHSGPEITVTPHATMVDASGHNLNVGVSWIDVVAVAWVGVNDDNLKLGSAPGIPNGGSSIAIAIPSTTPDTLKALLAGFHLSYGSSDHHVETIDLGVGTLQSGSSACITGVAQMYDDSGNKATEATVDGSLLANCDPSLLFPIRSTDNLNGNTKTLTFPSGVSNYMPVITNCKMQFKNNDDNHVKALGAYISVASGTSVTVTGNATVSDNSGHVQDPDISHVSGFVIGY